MKPTDNQRLDLLLVQRNLLQRATSHLVGITLITLGMGTLWVEGEACAELTSRSRPTTVELEPALHSRCLAELRSGLESDEFWPAMHAAEALTLAGLGNEVLSLLPPRLDGEEDHQRRCGLARELVRAGDRRAIHRLLDVLADPSSTGRIHAGESLYKIAEVGDGQSLRDAMRQGEDRRLQLMAAAALARGGNPEALLLIRSHLSSTDGEARKIAAWILGLLGDARDIARLRSAISLADDDVARSYFHNALACLGDSAAQAVLLSNLDADDPAIRTYAAEFSGYSRMVDAREKLIGLLSDDNLDVRIRAAQSLIMLSQPADSGDEPFVREVFPANQENPRYSEGSTLTLTDGRLVYATTEFVGGGADHATAHIVATRSTDMGKTWSTPEILQENVGTQNVMSVTLRRLLPGRHDGPIGMFYLVKNSPQDLHVFLKVSTDEMETWSESRQVTQRPGYHVMNNDRVTVTSTGRLVCPIAWTPNVTANGHFICLCYYSDDGGTTWKESAGEVDEQQRGAMEPEVVELRDGRLMMIIRTQMGYIATSYSEDGGDHWSAPGRLPVVAPEAPSTIRRIPATGDLLLIWNNHFEPGTGHGGKRWPLTTAISRDEGTTWENVRDLDAQPREAYAYTSVEFVRDRAIITYYVHDEESGRISSRLRSNPVSWFYASEESPETPVATESAPVAAEDWPQFRGPNASGVAATDHSLPTKFSLTEGVRWSAELGDGVASPVISAGRAFTTAMTGDETFAVFCFDVESGKELWQRQFATGTLPRITPPNSHASSTPACDGERLYVHFSTLGIVAMDVEDGRTLWRYQLPLPAYLMDWGAAASPIVFENTVYFNQDDDLASALFAIAAETGELRWRVERPEMLAGYAVPVLCHVNGKTELVIAGSGKMIGYDPATGEELWSCRTLPRTVMTSPVVRDDIIYVAVQSYGDESRTLKFALLEWLDTNQDGILERAEVPKEFWERFDRSDRDGDGKLSGDELDTAFQSAENLVGGGSIIQAIRAGGRGDVTKTHLVWGLENRSPSNLSSPLVVGNQLLVVKKGGLSSSFDAATGETHWALKRIQNLGDYYGSPVAGDGKIYLAGENGFIVVLAQGPELEILGRCDMGESCIATPALAQGRIFIRTRHHLYCIGHD